MRSNYLLSELARYHRVDLLALNHKDLLLSYFDSEEEGISKAKEQLAARLEYIGICSFEAYTATARRLLALKSLISEHPYSVGWLTSHEMARAIKRRLAETHYDLVHFDTLGLAQYRHLVIGIPTALDHHNIESHMMLRRAAKESNPVKKAYFFQEGHRLRRYEKAILKRFDTHVTCSEVDRERLLALDGSIDVKVIPNTVRIPEAYPRPVSLTKKMLFIGGLDWYPNRDAMLHFCRKIWPEILRRVPEAQMDIVGKNPGNEILAAAEAYPGLRVHGFVEGLDHLYQEAAVFVCPIRDGGGTKLKVLDAMAHQLPVIGYPESCEGLAIKDGNHALIARSSGDFAAKAVRLLCDPKRAWRLGAEGYRLVAQRYDAVRVGRDLSEYYLKLAKKI